MDTSVVPDTGFALPVGTVTFLLTDVEGSTRFWEHEPAAAGPAILAHYEVIHEVVARRGGVRPVEQGEGDSAVAAFSRPSDAVAAALDILTSLRDDERTAGINVRIGIHTGEALVRGGTGYFGEALNRCARLRSIGHGGQVLVSHATAELVQDRLPDEASLVDLGIHRLKDLARAEHVYQLAHPDTDSEFPPLRSLDTIPNNLPRQLSTFIGREREMQQLADLLDQHRIVTITGSGGCGKTRLALHVAADRVDAYGDGAWVADLASVSHPDLVHSAVANALSVREVPHQSVEDTLTYALRAKQMLLVIDNCEHVIEAAARLIHQVASGCPGVVLLATSREPLGIEGEHCWRVPSMALPGPDEQPAVETLTQYDAVRLFVERATQTRPNFTITNENAPAVAGICQTLDGIPLAIELAASRTRLLSPQEIVDGLSDSFRMLTRGARTALPRQQTLLASVDWSFNLLNEQERTLLRRLSVFVGGFDLDAAEHVCADDALVERHLLDILSSLVDKSLVQPEESADRTRYRLLETIRQYAAQKLIDAGEHDRFRDLHLAYFVAFAREQEPRLQDHGGAGAADRIDADFDNMRAAIAWSEGRDVEGGLRIYEALAPYWFRRGHWMDARARGEVALAAGDADPELRSRVLASAAMMAATSFDLSTTLTFAERSIAIADALEDRTVKRFGLFALGVVFALLDPGRARPLLEESADLAGRAGDEAALLRSTSVLGIAEAVAGNLERALELLEESADAARATGSDEMLMGNSWWRCLILIMRGDLTGATAAAEEGAAAAERLGNPQFLAYNRMGIGDAALFRGDYETAERLITDALELALRMNDIAGAFLARLILGTAFLARGDVDRATDELSTAASLMTAVGSDWNAAWAFAFRAEAALCNDEGDEAMEAAEAAMAAAERSGNPSSLAIALWVRGLLGRIRGDIRSAESLQHEALAAAARVETRLIAPYIFRELAVLADAQESPEEATRLFAAADSLNDAMGVKTFPWQVARYESVTTGLRASLGEESFDTAWAEGSRLTFAEAVGYAQRGRGIRKRPSHGWDSLTPTELGVVKLVAKGMTNPQIAAQLFISKRTVQAHLAHVFEKLGAATRAEVAAEASRRGL